MSTPFKALYTLKPSSEINALLAKAELDLKRFEIRLFFKKTVNSYARQFFIANLTRILQKNVTPVPKVTPVTSKARGDTSQEAYHQVTELWVGLVNHHALSRCYPLWRHPAEIPERSFLLAFAKDVDDFLTCIEKKWTHDTLPHFRDT